jgi:hypothetical protein
VLLFVYSLLQLIQGLGSLALDLPDHNGRPRIYL